MRLKDFVNANIKPGKGKIVFVGARPAVGKTSFVLSCAEILSLEGRNILYFDLENSLTDRLNGSKIPNCKIVTDECIDAVLIREKCVAERDKANLIVIIDYLQLVDRLDGSLFDVQKELRSIADEQQVTIIVTSQLPGIIDNRDDKRPNENDMELLSLDKNMYNNLIFLYRPAYYDSNADRRKIYVIADGVENEMIWDEDGLSVE